MRRADEHSFDKVFVFGTVSRNAHTTTVLRLIFCDGQALDISTVSERDNHLLNGDKIGVFDIAQIDFDLRFAVCRIFALDFEKVGLYYVEYSALVCQNVFKVGNRPFEFGKFVVEFVNFEM